MHNFSFRKVNRFSRIKFLLIVPLIIVLRFLINLDIFAVGGVPPEISNPEVPEGVVPFSQCQGDYEQMEFRMRLSTLGDDTLVFLRQAAEPNNILQELNYDNDPIEDGYYSFVTYEGCWNLGFEENNLQLYVSDVDGEDTYNFSFTLLPPMPSVSLEDPWQFSGSTVSTESFTALFFIESGDGITSLQWYLNENAPSELNPLDYYGSESHWASFNVSGYQYGDNTFYFRATNSLGGVTLMSYPFTSTFGDPPFVDETAPTCTGWQNITSPHYSRDLSYSVSCSDDVGITSATYRVYHSFHGNIVADQPLTPVSGSFGDTNLSFNLNYSLPLDPNRDGLIIVYLTVEDEGENSYTEQDPLVVDYADQTAPTIYITPVAPDPVHNANPVISGSCVDNTVRETNSAISSIETRLNGGSWQAVTPRDDEEGSPSKKYFSRSYAGLAEGNHQVDIRCTDAASNVQTESVEFNVSILGGGSAAAHSYQELFTSTDRQDIPNSTLIWGNGRLRLKETIGVTRTALDSSEFKTKYDEYDYNQYVIVESLNEASAWYAKKNKVFRVNFTDDSTNEIVASEYGLSSFGQIKDLLEVEYDSKNYLVIAQDSRVSIVNLTDEPKTGIEFQLDNAGARSIAADTQRGRFGLYFAAEAIPAGQTKLAYTQLSLPLSHSSTTFFSDAGSVFSGTDVTRVFKGPNSNEYYLGVYGQGLYRFNDNNTPTNLADDLASLYAYENVFGITFDRSGQLIFATAESDSGELFTVTDLGDEVGSPYDTSDDTVLKLADERQLGYQDIFRLHFIESSTGVGDQLILEAENGNALYVNLNDTYTNLYDDTIIELGLNAGERPAGAKVVVANYDTLYAVVDIQGLYKIDLDRGWESSGKAISLPPRPDSALLINNFTLDATTLDPISPTLGMAETNNWFAWIGGLIPQAFAQGGGGIVYHASLDDGVTWQEVTPGEAEQLVEEDYRVQVRISMTPVEGDSPVLDSYSLDYGGYTAPEQIGSVVGFGITTPGSVNADTDFNISVDADDVFGNRVTAYNETVSLELQNQDGSSAQSFFNSSSLIINSGVGSFSGARITQPGIYRIEVTQGSLSSTSSLITVTATESQPSPTLTLSVSDSTPKYGDVVTLTWTSTHLSSLRLEPGNVNLGIYGSREEKITSDKTFTIYGTGPGGSISKSVTVTLDRGEDANNNDSSQTRSGGLVYNPLTNAISYIPRGVNDPFETDKTSEPKNEISLKVSGDQFVLAGDKVRIWWEATGADRVIVDYFTQEQPLIGEFEFYPSETTTITITAIAGDAQVTKQVAVEVKPVPEIVQSLLPPGRLRRALTSGFRSSWWLLLLVLLLILLAYAYKKYRQYRRNKNQR